MRTEPVVPALLWGLAILFVGAVVHIVSILILPRTATRDAFAQVAQAAAPNRMQTLPKPRPGQDALAFRDPALASAVCRYDLEDGPLRVDAAVADAAFVSVSFHSRFGVPFYALNDRASNEGKIEVLLMSPSQLEKAEAADSEDGPVREVRVTSPTTEGFVLFDVMARVGGYAASEQALKSVGCKVERGL